MSENVENKDNTAVDVKCDVMWRTFAQEMPRANEKILLKDEDGLITKEETYLHMNKVMIKSTSEFFIGYSPLLLGCTWQWKYDT